MVPKGLPSSPGAVVAQLRQRRGWTQQALAEKLGVGHAQIVSSIEKGQRSLKATEIARLAEIFSVSALDLLQGRVPPEAPFVLWRDVRDSAAQAEEESRLQERCRRYAWLEELADEPPAPDLPRLPLRLPGTSYETVCGWAHDMRSKLSLNPEIPAAGLRDVLEGRHRIQIFHSELRGGSGAATRGAFGGAIMLARDDVDGRQAFSLAHELFHLLTWEVVGGGPLPAARKRRNEELANVFASALLLPEESLRARVGGQPLTERRWMALVRIAAEYRVTLPALVYRLVNLHLVPADQAKTILESPALRRLRQSQAAEAAEDLRDLPSRYVHLALSAFVTAKISTGKLAEMLETTVGLLPEKLAAYGLDPELDAYQAAVLPG